LKPEALPVIPAFRILLRRVKRVIQPIGRLMYLLTHGVAHLFAGTARLLWRHQEKDERHDGKESQYSEYAPICHGRFLLQ
jgi:hypothetical protein